MRFCRIVSQFKPEAIKTGYNTSDGWWLMLGTESRRLATCCNGQSCGISWGFNLGLGQQSRKLPPPSKLFLAERVFILDTVRLFIFVANQQSGLRFQSIKSNALKCTQSSGLPESGFSRDSSGGSRERLGGCGRNIERTFHDQNRWS